MSVYHGHAWCLEWPEEGVGSPGTKIINDCGPVQVLGLKPIPSGRTASTLYQ